MMSLALCLPGEDREREVAFYRFTVRCDRPTNMKIEAAAKKAGLSPTAFVQQHFDTILAGNNKPFDSDNFDLLGFSKRHHVSVGAARLYARLRAEADAEGKLKSTIYELADHFRVTVSLMNQYRIALVDTGLVKKSGRTRGPEAWRVLEEG